MYIALQLFGIIMIISIVIIISLWNNNILLKNFSESRITYFSITSSVSNTIGLLLFLYSIYISQNYTNIPSSDYLDKIFYSYIFLFYITFIVILFLIYRKDTFYLNKKYIVSNLVFLSIILPFIIFRNDLDLDINLFDDFDKDLIDKSIENGGLLDTIEYDNKGNKITITDKTKLEIRKKAAESEYNERIDIQRDIYD